MLITVVIPFLQNLSELSLSISSLRGISKLINKIIIVNSSNSSVAEDLVVECPFTHSLIVEHSRAPSNVYDAQASGGCLATSDYVLYLNCGDTIFSKLGEAQLRNVLANSRRDTILFRFESRLKYSSSLLLYKKRTFNHQAVLFACEGNKRFLEDVGQGIFHPDCTSFETLELESMVEYSDLVLVTIDPPRISHAMPHLRRRLMYNMVNFRLLYVFRNLLQIVCIIILSPSSYESCMVILKVISGQASICEKSTLFSD